MLTVTKFPGESDEAFRARAFAAARSMVITSTPTRDDSGDKWAKVPVTCASHATREQLRESSPSGLVQPLCWLSLRWHVRAVLAVVMTVSTCVWLLS